MSSQYRCFMTGESCPKKGLNKQSSKSNETQKKVFVLMPFKKNYYDYYEFGIKKYYSDLKIDCKYGAESHYKTGEYVVCKICEEIRSSDLIIADISDKNPNVYYELGMSHALSKKTIIISSDKTGIEDDIFLKKLYGIKIYSNIQEIKKILEESEEKNKKESKVEGEFNSNFSKSHSHGFPNISCLIPIDAFDDGLNRKDGKLSFSDVFEYSIKKSIKDINLLEDRKINTKNIKNIISEITNIANDDTVGKQSIKSKINEIVEHICKSRYFIIDFTKSTSDVCYWLGFIHGLGINPIVKVEDDSTYVYIAQEEPENLPFDIRATRIIRYESLEDLSDKISLEIERLERHRIHEDPHNKAKYNFWKHFNFRNTRFIFGSEFMFHPKEKKSPIEYRNRVSIQDFKTFNRIAYIILFLEPKRQLRYDIKFIPLTEFICKRDQPETVDIRKEMYEEPEKIEISKKILLSSKLLSSRDFWFEINSKKTLEKNYIIIGSSCVNVAVEEVMYSLYTDDNDKCYGYTFKTTRPYKLRSRFWEEAKPSEMGIYFFDKNELTQICTNKSEKIRDDIDFGLLLVFNNLTLKSSDNGKKKKMIRGRFIVLCGFRKYGTYGLGRMVSNYVIKKDQIQEEQIYLEKGAKVTLNDIISIINDKISESEDNKELYCIEAVFEFLNKDFEKNFEKTEKVLRAFYKYDREHHSRDDLLPLLKK